MELVRLQKLIALAGTCSRRAAEKLILEGRVKVDGKVVTTLGAKVSSDSKIYVDNKLIGESKKVYYIMNKPEGYICDLKDNYKRHNLRELLDFKTLGERLYPIEPLNYNYSGAVLLTNDGVLKDLITKKSRTITVTYQVRIDNILSQAKTKQILKGVKINDKVVMANIIDFSFDREHSSTLIKLSLVDSEKDIVVKFFNQLGYKVKKVKRLDYAYIDINGLASGNYRPLKIHEIKKLYSI